MLVGSPGAEGGRPPRRMLGELPTLRGLAAALETDEVSPAKPGKAWLRVGVPSCREFHGSSMAPNRGGGQAMCSE